MSPETLQRTKSIQTEAAKYILYNSIKNQYRIIKQNNGNQIANSLNNFNQGINNTSNQVSATLGGRTLSPLLNTLNLISNETYNLTNGVSSINAPASIPFNVFSNSINQSFSFSFSSYKTIQLLDGFVNTKDALDNTIPNLQAIKSVNNNLYSQMESSFNSSVEHTASVMSHLSYPEVLSIANEIGLSPADNIDQGQVQEVSMLVALKIAKIEETSPKILTAFTEMHNTDEKNASLFVVTKGKKKKKKENSHKYENECKARDRDATIFDYQITYGLTYDQAVYLFDVYDPAMAVYADKQGWNEEEYNYQYFMTLASFGYHDWRWRPSAGTLKPEELDARLKEMGIEEKDAEKLNELMQTGPHKIDDNGDGVVDDKDKTVVDDNPNNDFIHMCASISVMLNPDVSAWTEIGTMGEQDKYSNYEGDVISGSFGFADVRANMDAYNIARRIKEGNSSPIAVSTQYAKEVAHGEINPAQEFIDHYEIPGDDRPADEIPFKEKKKAFEDDVKHKDINPASILIEEGEEGDKKTPEDYLDYFDLVLNGELEAPNYEPAT